MSSDGQVSTFAGGQGGGGGPPLPASTLARLDELLATLPDDGGRLPPPNRRLLLQTSLGGEIVSRVYDRANAPEHVWEILGLCRCLVTPFIPELKPQSEIDARGFEHGGFLALSPDGRQLLFTGLNPPLQVWEPVAHELLAEVSGLGGQSIAFSPDGAQALVCDGINCALADTRTWKFTRQQIFAGTAQFTREGRCVVLSDGKNPAAIYEVGTWRRVDHLPEVPAEAVRFVSAAKSPRAVVQTTDGRVALWDTAAHREIAELRDQTQLTLVAFSPDESLVAVSSDRKNDNRIPTDFGIWRTDTGEQLHELRTFAPGSNERREGLLWSLDGAYLLAGIPPSYASSNVIDVFSVRTGRLCGVLTGCLRINGIVLLPDGSQLAAGDTSGKIHFWDFKQSIKTIREFEATLPPLPTL